MKPHVFDATTTAHLLPYSALADAISKILAEYDRGQIHVAERTVMPLGEGTLLVMPAADAQLTITKTVTVHPANRARSLATINGEMMVAKTRDGQRLAWLHGATVTMRRTAALSLVAARALLRDRQGGMLVYGAGPQARGHIEAFHQDLGPRPVWLHSRTTLRAEQLVRGLQPQGIDATVIDNPENYLPRAAVVITATTSEQPVVHGGLRDDALVCAIGSFQPDVAELAPEVVRDAACVVVDTLEAARAEAGDLIQAVRARVWSWEQARPLRSVLGHVPPAHGYTVFKSVGHAVFDLAAARVAADRLASRAGKA